jgi:hypothetical protein
MTSILRQHARGSFAAKRPKSPAGRWENLPLRYVESYRDVAGSGNDVTLREGHWQRWPGDEWACFDALPPGVRHRLQQHAYDPWAVNALKLWQLFRRQTGSSQRAERRMLRYLDACEAQERSLFAEAYTDRHNHPLPHVAAAATVLRDTTNLQMPLQPPSGIGLRRRNGLTSLEITPSCHGAP